MVNSIINTYDKCYIYNSLRQCESKEQYDENYHTLREKYLNDKSFTDMERDYYLQTLQYYWSRGDMLVVRSFRQYQQHYFNSGGYCTGLLLCGFDVEPDGETMLVMFPYRCQYAVEYGQDKCKWNEFDSNWKWNQADRNKIGCMIEQCIFKMLQRENSVAEDAGARQAKRLAEL